MTRFQIGETLTTIAFRIDGKKATFGPYVPLLYDDIQPMKIVLNDLIVMEHHKVSNIYDQIEAEKIYDGFVLNSEDGKIWHNQYPRAEYGQISDRCDRIFSYAPTPDEAIDELLNDENQQELYTELGSIVIGRILRGIENLSKIVESTEIIPKANKVKSLDDLRQLNGLQEEIFADKEKVKQLKILLENIKQVYVAKYGNSAKFDAAVKERSDFVELLASMKQKSTEPA